MTGVEAGFFEGTQRRWRGIAAAAVTVTAFMTGAPAAAAIVSTTITIGDADCFGIGGACPAGSLIDLGAITAGAGDPAGTDVFGANGALSFGFNLILPAAPVTSASVSIRAVGLDLVDLGGFGDGFRGARILFDNGSGATDVGLFTPSTDPFNPTPVNEVHDILVSLDPALLVSGLNLLTLVPEEAFESFFVFEDFAIDVVRLDYAVNDDPTAVVPLPASALLLAGGLGALGLLRRRR